MKKKREHLIHTVSLSLTRSVVLSGLENSQWGGGCRGVHHNVVEMPNSSASDTRTGCPQWTPRLPTALLRRTCKPQKEFASCFIRQQQLVLGFGHSSQFCVFLLILLLELITYFQWDHSCCRLVGGLQKCNNPRNLWSEGLSSVAYWFT